MEMLELMRKRRSIRKYTDEQISEMDLNKIVSAGLHAPNAGGRQGTIIVGINSKELATNIGKLNYATFSRASLSGSYVSKDQPSIIDDPNIRNGFYDAPSIAVVFAERNFLYSVPDAFCAAENMVIEATSLGISSCIIARAEETFNNPEGQNYLEQWQIPSNYIARCFVILGYCKGEYPKGKELKAGRYRIIK